jgi:hypothetical protein
MESSSKNFPPTYKIHSGWCLRLQQAAFSVHAVKYLQKNKYPLFTVKGTLTIYWIGRVLKRSKCAIEDT